MILKVVGYTVMAVGCTVMAVNAIVMLLVGLVATWFLAIGGLFDLFSDRTLTSGIPRIDDVNRDALAEYGGTTVGLVKIIVLEPVVAFVVSVVFSVGQAVGIGIAGAGYATSALWSRRRRRREDAERAQLGPK